MRVIVVPIVVGPLGTVPKGREIWLEGLEIVEDGQNIEKNPGDLRRLEVTQTPVKDC